MTAATAALDPEPLSGLGIGRDRRRHHRDHRRGLRPLGTRVRRRHRLLAPDPAPQPHRHDRPGHRRDGSPLRRGVHRVRQPPRSRLPVLLGGVQAGRPPARPRGPGRRQRHPRDDHRAPVRVRHPHRPLLRPGPRPPPARQDRAAVPTPPRRQRPALPARPRHLLPDPARRGRPPARPADVPGLLRLPIGRAVQRLRGGSCGAGSSPTCPGTWPGSPGSPRRPCGRSSASGSSRSPNTRHAAWSTSTP